MRYIAAYFPAASDITNLLSSVGIEADSERVDALLKAIDGKDVAELIAEGTSKLASVPSGGAVAGGSAGAAAGGAAAAAEEAKEEEKEESDDDMGFGLFD
ncbi:60s acidic ribosomal protein-domain-containing protein [Syncephalis fuscata]|nr:60s acidic ribosomal protein-domain-containing protein [Syncephalis fuscata]